MRDYEELVERLRAGAYTVEELSIILPEAADAIEELCGLCASQSKDCSEAVAKYLELWAKQPRWIPVTERLPEEAGRYLVCGRWRGKQPEIWVCEFMLLGCLKGWVNNAANPCVSNWMPIPEPPKEES